MGGGGGDWGVRAEREARDTREKGKGEIIFSFFPLAPRIVLMPQGLP